MIRVLYFLGGVVVGAAATYLILRKKTEQEIQEEIEAFKENYKPVRVITSSNQTEKTAKDLAAENEKKKAELFQMTDIVEKQNYNLFSKPPRAIDIHNGIDEGEDLRVYSEEDDPGSPREDLAEKPYTISQDDFVNGERYFDKITLNYYDDKTLIEEISGEIIDDIDAAVGWDSLTKFGEYEEDVVFVRNERTSTDYEVIRQYRNYKDLPKDDI